MTNPCNCRNRTRRATWWRRLLDAVRMGKHMCQCTTCGRYFSCNDPTDNDCGNHNR